MSAPMNALAPAYKRAATDADPDLDLWRWCAAGFGQPLLDAAGCEAELELPVAVLGFGDRAFPRFCRFAEDVAGGLARQRLAGIAAHLNRIDKQSAQDFARWGAELGAAIGTPLTLDHVGQRPKTVSYALVERADYGREVQAPTSILRFVAPEGEPTGRSWWRLVWRPRKLPQFQPGDLVGILPPGSNVPRFYSLASSSRDGILEICVRKQPGGLCSGFLHESGTRRRSMPSSGQIRRSVPAAARRH